MRERSVSVEERVRRHIRIQQFDDFIAVKAVSKIGCRLLSAHPIAVVAHTKIRKDASISSVRPNSISVPQG